MKKFLFLCICLSVFPITAAKKKAVKKITTVTIKDKVSALEYWVFFEGYGGKCFGICGKKHILKNGETTHYTWPKTKPMDVQVFRLTKRKKGAFGENQGDHYTSKDGILKKKDTLIFPDDFNETPL